MYVGLLGAKCRLFLSHFNEAWIFPIHFFFYVSNIKFHENPPVVAELCRADGQADRQTDMMMLVSAFRNFANAPKDTKKLLCAVTCIPRSSEQEWNNGTFQREQNVIVWFKDMLYSLALTLISRARFDARCLSSSYLQDLLSMTQQPLVRQALLVIEASRLHSDTPHTVGRLWVGDQPDTQTSTWQHTTLKRERPPYPRRNSNPQSQQVSGHTPRP
jgi:hypothetical protein